MTLTRTPYACLAKTCMYNKSYTVYLQVHFAYSKLQAYVLYVRSMYVCV